MIPLSDVGARVRVRYEAESGGATTRYTNTSVYAFINDGLRELAEATLFYERYVTIPLEAEQRFYDLRGFTPETVVRIKSVWSTTRNDWLRPTAVEDFDTTWEQSVGEPQRFFTRGIYWLAVDPVPSSTAGFLRVYFAGIPGEYTHAQAVLGDLPDDYVPALEAYALYEMAAMDRKTKSALLYWKDYQTREKSLAGFVDRRSVEAYAGRIGGTPASWMKRG